MKLEKAIEINKENKQYFEDEGFTECAEAAQLGIKAMEFGKGYFGATNFLYLIEHQGETLEP
ncbi:unnamed protein product [marine sediment metagenome]|uniref:Uncharacterized protein n=1 Tax=marine sediment metagenome TaxID=412755 RepID=X1P798_9ZZZZ